MRKLTPEEAEVSRLRRNAKVRDWQKANPEKFKEYMRRSAIKNADKKRAYMKSYNSKKKDKINARVRVWYQNNKEKARAYVLKWRSENREKLLASGRKSNLKMRQNKSSNRYLSMRLRSRMNKAIKGGAQLKQVLDLLGCPVDLFRLHLQNQFRDGMAWNNHGTLWHIDHIKPCAKFDLRDLEQRKLCFHYSNMQPLLADENRRKGARYVT